MMAAIKTRRLSANAARNQMMQSRAHIPDWVEYADSALLRQEPLRARGLLWITLAVCAWLTVWASFAEVDEVTRGAGKVIPSSQLQVIQSVDGGVVEEILVREGQHVEAGDLLLRIDKTRFVSTFRESRAEFLSLAAKAARLTALTENAPLQFPQEVLDEAPDVAEHERKLYQSTLDGMNAQIAIVRDQLNQREQELNEARSRRDQAARTLELVARELAVTRPLVGSGAVSEVEVLRLQRDSAKLAGERDQAAAQVSRVQAAIAESTRKIEEVELNIRNRMRGELSDTMSRLSALSQGSVALEDKVRQAEVRSPVRGTVVRMRVSTLGAVVQPGREVVEVLPLDDALVLEVHISPRDIAFLRPGQTAQVKFTAYDFSIYGGLEGKLEHLSADSITDETGETYYLARVRTKRAQLADNLPIIPGMVAEVDILTGKRTILSYLLKPVTRAKAKALTER